MRERHQASDPRHPSRLMPAIGDAVSSFWRRVTRGTRLLRHADDWGRFVGKNWDAEIMQVQITDRLTEKQGRSIGRKGYADSGEQLWVFLKRHYRLPWWRGILATLFPGRAWSPGLQEWQHLHWAEEQGFPVPRPIAAGQFVGPGFKLQGFLAVEELRGMLPLHEAVPLAAERQDAATFAKWKRGLTVELARLARELHRRKVFHKDLYFCHFYLPESFTREPPQEWKNRVVMIDLHRLARHTITAAWWQAKDLAQLLYSSDVPGVTARDRVRFWKLYRSGLPGRAGWNRLRLLIRWKWRLYVRHETRRAAHSVARCVE